jgi:hypothetical protein
MECFAILCDAASIDMDGLHSERHRLDRPRRLTLCWARYTVAKLPLPISFPRLNSPTISSGSCSGFGGGGGRRPTAAGGTRGVAMLAVMVVGPVSFDAPSPPRCLDSRVERGLLDSLRVPSRRCAHKWCLLAGWLLR